MSDVIVVIKDGSGKLLHELHADLEHNQHPRQGKEPQTAEALAHSIATTVGYLYSAEEMK
jgi:HPt (histidine-containing phosphotransfer) domain-containing protein